MNSYVISRMIFVLIPAWLALLLTACGGSTSSGPTPTSTLAPTPLQFEFKQPTTIIEENEEEKGEAEEEATSTPEPTPEVDLSRGERIYGNKGCGECHGEQLKGVADKGEKLTGSPLTEAEFTDILRTGGQGELGNDHLYGPQAISPSGMEALYAYVKSFQ